MGRQTGRLNQVSFKDAFCQECFLPEPAREASALPGATEAMLWYPYLAAGD